MKSHIQKIIQNVLPELGLPQDLDFDVETKNEKEFGDYSSNIAFAAVKTLQQPPQKIAEAFKVKLEASHKDIFKKIEVAGTGFLNFFIAPDFWLNAFADFSKNPVKHLYAPTPKNPKTKIEVISANPTGPLTIANARGGFFADTLANILAKKGVSTTREYYLNDRGHQIQLFGESILAALGKIEPREEHYQGEYIKEIAKAYSPKIKKMLPDSQKAGTWGIQYVLKNYIKPVIKKAKIKIDNYFFETSLYKNGWSRKAFAILKEKNLTYESDGAIWLKTKELGDERDRVLIRREGEPTYLASDAAYILENAASRGFTRIINPLGADHYGTKKSLEILNELLGGNSEYLVIILQHVTLKKADEKVRMSKRKGQFFTLTDLIDEVGLDAVRYFFLEHQPGTHIDFDINLAKTRNEKNPVYYIQYAHARMSSILRKAPKQSYKLQVISYKLLTQPAELKLIKKILALPELLEEISQNLHVHLLPAYTYELAHIFTEFYRDVPVLKATPELHKARLELIKTAQKVLQETLSLMGISAPQKM